MPSSHDYFCLSSEFHASVRATTDWLLSVPGFVEERWPLVSGAHVTDWNDQLFLTTTQEGEKVDFPRVAGSWHVVSQRMQTTLAETAAHAIQFLPVRIRTVLGQNDPSAYFVANYRNMVDALDLRRSVALDQNWSTDESGDFLYIEKLVLSRRSLGRATVFRVGGKSDCVVFRGDIIFRLREVGITGCVFTPIETSD